MTPAPSRLDRPSFGLVAKALLLMLTLAAGAAIPLVNSRTVLALEIILAVGAIGFAIFYSLVRAELSLVGALGAYLLGLASLFATLNNVRVVPVTGGALPAATVSDVLLLASGVTLVAAGLVEHYAWPPYPRLALIGAGVLALSVALSAALQSGGARPTGVFFLTGVVLTPLVVGAGTRSRTALLIAILMWLSSAAANGVVAFLDFKHLTDIGGLTVDGRANGLTVQPNYLGLACAMLIPVGVVLFVAVPKLVLRVSVAALIICAAIGLLVSGSRAATLGVLFGLVMVPLLGYRRRLQTVVLTLAAFATVGVGYAVSASAFVSLQRLTGQLPGVQAADLARIDAWQAALNQIATSPVIGSGYSAVAVAHDLALQVLVSGGAIGLLGYALFIAAFVILGVHCCRDRTLDRQLSVLSAGLTASASVFLINGVVSDQIYDRFLYWPFGLLLAIKFISRQAAAMQDVESESGSVTRQMESENSEAVGALTLSYPRGGESRCLSGRDSRQAPGGGDKNSA